MGVTGNQAQTAITEQVDGASDIQQAEKPGDADQTNETVIGVEPEDGVFVTYDEALDIFGVGDRHGTGSPNTYALWADDDDVTWAPIFKDEVAFKENLSRVLSHSDVPRSEVPKLADAHPIRIRFSQYTRAQVEQAEKILGDMEIGDDPSIFFTFDPSGDAMRAICNPDACSAVPETVGDVAVDIVVGKIENL